MPLKPVDKIRYNKHLKITFFAICAYLLLTALAVSTLLIALVGSSDGGNFWLNVAGTIIAVCGFALLYQQFKEHPFFSEIIYVRDLKAQMNAIYRKQRAIKEAAEKGDTVAMSILDFSYSASHFVYSLDDNTITLEDLAKSQQELQGWADAHHVSEYPEYHSELVKKY
jgi:hypothetical protein